MVNKYVDSGQQHMSEYVLHCKRKRKRGSGRTAPPLFKEEGFAGCINNIRPSFFLCFFPSFLLFDNKTRSDTVRIKQPFVIYMLFDIMVFTC